LRSAPPSGGEATTSFSFQKARDLFLFKNTIFFSTVARIILACPSVIVEVGYARFLFFFCFFPSIRLSRQLDLFDFVLNFPSEVMHAFLLFPPKQVARDTFSSVGSGECPFLSPAHTLPPPQLLLSETIAHFCFPLLQQLGSPESLPPPEWPPTLSFEGIERPPPNLSRGFGDPLVSTFLS